MKRVAVLASGGGSNLGAILDYFSAQPAPPATVHLVVSDRPGAGALQRGANRGARTVTLADPADGEALTRLLTDAQTDIVVLAGYLRLVPVQTTVRFAGAIVNVHPALLPRYGGPGMYGQRVHRAVLAAGDSESGATVHFVDAQYDHGTPIAWARVPVQAGDTPETLAARVLTGEHFILPRVVHGLAAGQIRLAGSGAVVVASGAEALFAKPPHGVAVRLAG